MSSLVDILDAIDAEDRAAQDQAERFCREVAVAIIAEARRLTPPPAPPARPPG